MTKRPTRRQALLRIAEDPRVIVALYGGGAAYHVGQNGITEILAYTEPGQGAYEPWYAVYLDDDPLPTFRMIARFWTVQYEEGHV